MPNRTPSSEASDKFVFRADTMGTEYAAVTALTPQRVKLTLQAAEIGGELGGLYGLYERMETTDTRFGGLVGQLKAAIGGFDLKVTEAPGATEGEEKAVAEDYAEVMREVISMLDAQSVTKEFCSPYVTGATLYRLKWSLEDYAYGRKMWLPNAIEPVDGRAMLMEKDQNKDSYGEMKVRVRNGRTEGTNVRDLPNGSSLFLEAGSGRDRYARMGVARKVLPWYLGIQFVQSWWIQYIEGYGAPLRIGRHPRGVDPAAKINMERFLKVLGQHGYALFPNDMEVQLVEANRQGTITTYGDFISKGHEEYAVALLGQAETVGTDSGGSYAKSVVSNSIRYEIMQDVANIVARGWRMLAEMVMRINYGESYNRRLLPVIRPVLISPTEALTKARVAVMAQDNGVAVPHDYWFDQILDSPKPRAGEKAILYGQEFVEGEARPKPREVQKQEAAAKEAEKDRKAQKDSENANRQDRSVSESGNPDYGSE